MSLKQNLKEIDSLESKLAKLKKQINELVMADLKSLMKDNPEIDSIKWQQYTPSFNDGDVCEFGIHGPYIRFTEDLQPRKESHYNDHYMDLSYNYDLKEFFKKATDILNFEQISRLQKVTDQIAETFANFQYEDLKTSFGDGYEITVTSTGVEVEDYDHD